MRTTRQRAVIPVDLPDGRVSGLRLRRLWLAISACLIPFFAGCPTNTSTKNAGRILPFTEVVLTPGMTVTATNPNGTVSLHATGSAVREISGDGWKTEFKLIPRTTRWYGSLGLYNPAESSSPYGRLLVDEGRLHFDSVSDALKHLYVDSQRSKWVYTNDGLVVGYDVSPIPGGEPTRSVTLWQIYVDGKKPTSMPGADDSAIKVEGGATTNESTPYPAEVGLEMTFGKQEYRPIGVTEGNFDHDTER